MLVDILLTQVFPFLKLRLLVLLCRPALYGEYLRILVELMDFCLKTLNLLQKVKLIIISFIEGVQ